MLDRTTSYGDMEDEDFDRDLALGFMSSESGGYSSEDEDHFDNFANGYDGEYEDEDHFSYEFEAEGSEEVGSFSGYGEAYDGESFDGEGDEFFGSIWKAAKKAASAVAPIAKKFAPQIGSVIGGALGGPAGAAIGGKLGGFVQQMEAEDEGESEDEMNAVADVPTTEDQLAESVAHAASRGRAADAQSLGSQITIFIGSRAPLPVKTVLPVLSQASGNVARALVQSRDPRARALIRTLPTIQRRTVATLTQKARAGKPVTPRIAVRVMAKHANRTLSNQQAIGKALASNAAKKRSLDRRAIKSAERFS
ncbi:DUF1320 domain-containing protein [Sphingomonas sp. S2-65]|uniref:DUF1320 domain-containing protein n=1 Tax=Sphingomonas sp. S2-65 TaxID=2903960 RepID=UPI001F19612C|nr:DUF1320 domain-containing protein [Sphingomonas sp. S2-65]UYY57243.1 DUF1320 domain-containing protein [Sphingomonas sp. S2-65]